MTVKDEMRMLIEILPDDATSDALDYMRWLAQEVDTLTEAELAEVRLGEAEIASGHSITLDELQLVDRSSFRSFVGPLLDRLMLIQ